MNKGTSLAFIFLQFLPGILLSQNLVSNPGFEIYTQCPQGSNGSFASETDKMAFAPPWSRACGSPDFWHSCGSVEFAGPQQPRSGDGKAGFFAILDYPNYREYIQAPLQEKLIWRGVYRFTMYVSLADNCGLAVDRLGVHFSSGSISPFVLENAGYCAEKLPQEPQLVLGTEGAFLSDASGWMKLEGEYFATGEENFITIGNFSDDDHTPVFHTGSPRPDAYYYVDDVSLELLGRLPLPFEKPVVPNIFTPNGDGSNDLFRVDKLSEDTYVELYNRWGEQVARLTANAPAWNGIHASGQPCPDGVYYFVIIKEGVPIDKGFFQLTR